MARGKTKAERTKLESEYVEVVGREPEMKYPEGTDGYRQFAYRGTTEEDAETLALLGVGNPDEETVILEGQDQLF